MCGLFEKDLLLLVQFYEVAIKIGFLLVEQLGLMENPIDLKHGFPPKWVYIDTKLKVLGACKGAYSTYASKRTVF